MLLGMIGTNELIIIGVLGIAIIFLVFRFVYVHGKRKGRIEELEKRIKDASKNN